MTSLYVHIPFCARKCFYCSFVVTIGQEKRIDAYLDALEREAFSHGKASLKTIYIGGGTPSHLSVNQLQRLCTILKEHFDLSVFEEWTVECNPDGLDEAKLDVLLKAGVNRFSLGIQTFSEARLKELGRTHTGIEAREAFYQLQKKGCRNINVDFMFAFPRQTKGELIEDLEKIASLSSQHLSLYCLNVEPNSKFYAQKIQQPADDTQADFYKEIVSFLEAHAFQQYEVSNFARLGYQSQHNRRYWEGANYIGLGVGAHSHKDGHRFFNTSNFAEYIKKASNGQSCLAGEERLSAHERFVENVLFRLRMNEGVLLKELEERFATRFTEEQQQRIEQFVEGGFLIREGGRLFASGRGHLVLDELSVYLLPS